MIKSQDKYRSRSTTPPRTTRSHQRSSPSPKSLHLDPSVQLLLQSLQSSHTQIQQSVQLHTKLSQNSLPQRCLLHNNSISLYCCNEHRLICVNCVYSGNKHKSHKLIPTVDAGNEIAKDLNTYSFRLAQKVGELEGLQKVAVENQELVRNSQMLLVGKLDKQFDDIMRILANQYLELKTELNVYCDELYEANRQIAECLKNLNVEVESALEKIDEKQRKVEDPATKDPNIYKHLVLSRLVDSLQSTGQLKRVDQILDHIEALAQKELFKLKTDLTKHKWAKII